MLKEEVGQAVTIIRYGFVVSGHMHRKENRGAILMLFSLLYFYCIKRKLSQVDLLRIFFSFLFFKGQLRSYIEYNMYILLYCSLGEKGRKNVDEFETYKKKSLFSFL